MNVLRKECVGSKVWIKELGRAVDVFDVNITSLLAYGKTEFFIVKVKSKPLGKKDTKVIETDAHVNYVLIQKLKEEANHNFDTRTLKLVKNDFTLLGIAFPTNATAEVLAKIVLDLKDVISK